MDSPPPTLHRRPPRLLVAIAVVALLALGLWGLDSVLRPADSGIGGSGTIEGDEAPVSAEVAGRIVSFDAPEGSLVQAGAVVARLDQTLLQTQLQQAQAALEVARANTRLVEAGARPEDVRQAEAALAQAEATRDAAERAWKNAVAMRADPQDLNARINAAEAQLAAAVARDQQVRNGFTQADLDSARAAVESARTTLKQVETNNSAQEKIAAEGVAAAEARLRLLTQGARPEDVRAAELALEQAKDALFAAQASRDGICGNDRLPKFQCDSAQAQVTAAETAVNHAANNLQKVRNGPLPEEIRSAEASLQQARASRDAVIASSAPAVAAARANLEAAETRLRQMQAGATAEERAIAAAAVDQAQRALADLRAMRDNPLSANAAIDATRGQYEAATAAVDAARARLDALRTGPTPEQLAVARAQVGQAEAALGTVQAQIDRSTLTAPIAGVVSRHNGRIGDVATPGFAVATITSVRPLRLTIYITEARIGRVAIGQPADVTVDSFPGEAFAGMVVFVSPRAEFTPRNVQTQRDRATTVFAVRLQLPNDDGRLKPGMPADAKLR